MGEVAYEIWQLFSKDWGSLRKFFLSIIKWHFEIVMGIETIAWHPSWSAGQWHRIILYKKIKIKKNKEERKRAILSLNGGGDKKETSTSLILLWKAQGVDRGMSLDSCWEERKKAPLLLLHLPMLIASHPYLRVSESLIGHWEHAPPTRTFLLSTPLKARCASENTAVLWTTEGLCFLLPGHGLSAQIIFSLKTL